MQTKTQKRNQQKYKVFLNLVDNVSSELYSKKEWEEARAESQLGLQVLEMESNVYDTAYEREPEAFKGIQWINSSDSELPAWVRPGVEWNPDV